MLTDTSWAVISIFNDLSDADSIRTPNVLKAKKQKSP